MKQERIHRQRRQGNHADRDHGRERVPRCVKCARVKPLSRPERQGKREPEEIRSAGLRVCEQKLSPPVHQIDQRNRRHHHPSAGQQRSRGNPVHRVIHRYGEFFQLLLVEQPRKKRQRCLTGRLPQHGNRHREQPLSEGKPCDVADAIRRVVPQNPVIRRHERHAQHQRHRQLHPFAKRRIPHIKRRPVSGPNAQTALGCLSALHAASKSLPVLVVPRRNDALALCRSDYLALLDPAVRLSPGWVEAALAAMSSGAGIAVMKGALLIDMPACGHLRFDEPHEDVSEYLERARAAGVRVADWPSGYARVLPPASPSWKPRIASSEPSAPLHYTVRLAFRLWTTLAEFRARWPFLGKLAMGIPAALFDADWYRTRYPDVAACAVNPLLHYLYRGAFDGYDPNPHFHSAWYLANNPDVAASGLNPLLHFVRYGAREGRSPNVYFSTRWYIQQKPPLPVSNLNPLAHFITIGIR